MDRVKCSVEEADLKNETGQDIPGVIVTCERCDHFTESYGTTERSIKRCLALLREECPNGEENYYTTDESGEPTPNYNKPRPWYDK